MNKEFTLETVDRLADLLMIGLSDEEKQMIFDEFAVIDENINNISKIESIEMVKPMTHALDDFVCELREDVVEESIPIEDALRNCDDYDDREVSIVKVVG